MEADIKRLKLLWALAALAGLFAGLAAGAFGYLRDGLDAGWLIASLLALGVGFYVRALALSLLVWLFARPLCTYFGETDAAREGSGVRVTTTWRLSGDQTLDSYIGSYARAFEQVAKSFVWILIVLTVIAIAYLASLFGLVDFTL